MINEIGNKIEKDKQRLILALPVFKSITMSDVNERFNNWLAFRRIVETDQVGPNNFDCEDFVKTNGLRNDPDNNAQKKKKVYQPLQPDSSTFSFSPRVDQSIKNYLEQMDTFANQEPAVTDNLGVPLLTSVRCQEGDAEPGWSSSKILNPAELLLPTDQRLFVESGQPETIENDSDNEYYYENNTCVVYGDYMFVPKLGSVAVHRSEYPHEHIGSFEISSDLIDEDINDFYNIDNPEYESDSDHDIEEGLNIIKFMCIRRMFDEDVLLLCHGSSCLQIFEIEQILKNLNNRGRAARNASYTDNDTALLILKTPKACWSVDSITINDVEFIATGHNGPGVTLWAIRKNKTNHGITFEIISKEIISEHNVPSVAFIRPENGDTKYITLVFASIYGNITTVLVNTNVSDKKIKVNFLDMQFLGEFVWSVTPLKKNDFLSVSQFELLNLNFKEQARESITKSIVLDSKILNFQPKSVYSSGEYGIGTLTTQIQVPLANLSWLTSNRNISPIATLNFTTFDRAGKISTGSIKSGVPSNVVYFDSLLEGPRHSLQRMTDSFEADQPTFYYKYKEYQNIKNSNNDPRKSEMWKQCDLEIKVNNNIENKSEYKGFTMFSSGDDNNIEKFDIHCYHNRYYTSNDCNLKLGLNVWCKTPIPSYSEYYKSGFISPKWSDLTAGPTDDLPSKMDTTLTISHYIDQRKQWVHNHALKVKKLLEVSKPGYEPCGYKLPRNNNDILLVTTDKSILLVRPYPLIVTSFTVQEMFPIQDIRSCKDISFIDSFNRLNFVCHIKELNCIAVASQLGCISLLRLTEYRGIYSFRQEYILGWKLKDPFDERSLGCIQSDLDGWETQHWCTDDDILLPLFNIRGMDYTFYPEDLSNGIVKHAILHVVSKSHFYEFKIVAGIEIGKCS